MKTLRVAAIVAVLAAGHAGAGVAGGLSPSASVTTTVQGWEHYFRLEWTPQLKRGGVEIDGYAYNNYGRPMGGVRILAQALDDAGSVLGQKIEWVPGTVPPFGRSYFLVRGLPQAPHYRVSVWAFDIIDSPGGFPRSRF